MDKLIQQVTRQKWVLIIAGAVLLLVIVWYLAVYESTGSTISRDNKTLASDDTNIATLEATLHAEQQNNKLAPYYNAKHQTFMSLIPASGDYDLLAPQLVSLAQSANVAISPITLGSASVVGAAPGTPISSGSAAGGGSGGSMLEYPVTYSVSGTPATCIAFLSGIYDASLMPRLITVTSLTWTAFVSASGSVSATPAPPKTCSLSMPTVTFSYPWNPPPSGSSSGGAP